MQVWGREGITLTMVLDHSRRLHCHMVVVPLPADQLSIHNPESVDQVISAVAALLTQGQVRILLRRKVNAVHVKLSGR